ncbi:DUF2272 domain-containing protein [Chryseobacterium sp. GP-SGM7]|uniref:DUF2272 domain-containing protein n=1 Tax=Chryseobacterium sp. GP-SGM7 TaxID=3411323 RepID=UPI003B93CE4A
MSLKEQITTYAIEEWIFFNQQEINQAGHFIKKGKTETDEGYWQRVGRYWDFGVNNKKLTGKNTDYAWSAAFISYIMKKAGLQNHFLYSDAHCDYINKAIKAKQQNDAEFAFWGHKISDYKPKVGDLVCYSRQSGVDYDNRPNWYRSHSDIVVEVNANEIIVIGGNVDDSVSKKHLQITDGKLTDQRFQWFAVLENKLKDSRKSELPISDNSQKFTVTVDNLNIRKKPSINSEIVGTLNKNYSLTFLDKIIVETKSKDEKYYWFEIKNENSSAWVSGKYLKFEILQPLLDKYRDLPNDAVLDIVQNSGIAGTNWANGTAKLGYYQGMALMYGRLYCRLKKNDVIVKEMAKPVSGNSSKDSLKKFQSEFTSVDIDIISANETERLRYLFVLMFGLGLRESSGRHCCGKDPGANNTSADTTEAGLFQTSYNVRSVHPILPQIFKNYIQNPKGFLEVFAKEQSCSAANWANYGVGEGRYFQQLSKECPGFAVEFTAVAMRNTSTHWGPIKNEKYKAEIKIICNKLLMEVEKYITDNNIQEI